MPPIWTIHARRHLRQALAEKLCQESHGAETPGPHPQGCSGVIEETMDHLSEILAVTFDGKTVVVQDQVFGYRRKQGQSILMVEVVDPGDESRAAKAGRTGPYVVKIAPPEVLEREIHGWTCCRPSGLRHDLVFLDLEGVRQHDAGPLVSLVYGDAQQFLGVETTTSLEAAALDAVRFGVPTAASIGFVVVELYERIGHLLYGQSFIDDPARKGYLFDLPKLTDHMEHWQKDASCQTARRDVNTLAKSGPEQFLDPIDYLKYVGDFVPCTLPDGKTRPPKADSETLRQLGEPVPTVADLVPRLLRGCSHGDLHGRNVLVAIVRERALWPTVFYYEDMGPCNLIGWDFVKLETELKIRAYVEVFAGVVPSDFVKNVQAFEIDLDARTEQSHRDRAWPEVGAPESRPERLRAILLEIRRMAARHLGENVGRPNDWLEEYYFLLACYGIWTGKFENLQIRERMGALLSAGVAAARLNWPRLKR